MQWFHIHSDCPSFDDEWTDIDFGSGDSLRAGTKFLIAGAYGQSLNHGSDHWRFEMRLECWKKLRVFIFLVLETKKNCFRFLGNWTDSIIGNCNFHSLGARLWWAHKASGPWTFLVSPSPSPALPPSLLSSFLDLIWNPLNSANLARFRSNCLSGNEVRSLPRTQILPHHDNQREIENEIFLDKKNQRSYRFDHKLWETEQLHCQQPIVNREKKINIFPFRSWRVVQLRSCAQNSLLRNRGQKVERLRSEFFDVA